MSAQKTKNIVGIGAILVDEIYHCKQPVIAGTSNPSVLTKTAGGVMRNIMHHLALLDCHPTFITVIGNDADGQWILNQCGSLGINMQAAFTAECNTGKYAALINPDGSLHSAAVSNPAEDYLDISLLEQRIDVLSAADIIITDTNLASSVLQWLIQFCSHQNIPLIIEPVSVAKAAKLAPLSLEGVFMITPNEDEMAAISGIDNHDISISSLLQRGVQQLWLRSGAKGSAIYTSDDMLELAAPIIRVTDSTGAGDAALAAWVALYAHGYHEQTCLKASHAMAALVLQTSGGVAEDITLPKLLSITSEYYPS